MRRTIFQLLFAFSFLIFNDTLYAQIAPIKQWERTFGADSDEACNSVKRPPDGGFILGGSSSGPAINDKSQGSFSLRDFWVVKVDINGIKQWDKTIGGDVSDYLITLSPTTDSGYIMGCWSASGITGEKTSPSRGGTDYWVVKLRPAGVFPTN